MTWLARALSAALSRLGRSGGPAYDPKCLPGSGYMSHTAPTTSPQPAPDLASRIAARAERVSNRDRQTAARYRAVHLVLMTGKGG